MVIILQLCLFLIAVAIRGRYLFGKHLGSGDGSNTLSYLSKSRYGIKSRHIGLTQENGIAFNVKRERWYHRIFKAIGIASEIKISNPEFDHKYFIDTDYPDHLELTMASGQLQAHLQALFALPVKSLHATKNRIWCVIDKRDLNVSNSHYSEHLKLLAAISTCSSKSTIQDENTSRSNNLGLIAFLFICAHAGLLTLGIFGFFPTLADNIDTIDETSLAFKGMTAGLITSGAWFFLILHFFRQTSWICWVFVDFIFCGIIGFTLSGIFIMREVNAHYLQPPAKIFEQRIMQKSCELKCSKRCGKHCTHRSSYNFPLEAQCTPEARSVNLAQKKQADYICQSSAYFEYKVAVENWKKGPDYTFTPSLGFFDQIHVGTSLHVPVNTGALGLEWVDTSLIQLPQ
jgi:hypothetical protein